MPILHFSDAELKTRQLAARKAMQDLKLDGLLMEPVNLLAADDRLVLDLLRLADLRAGKCRLRQFSQARSQRRAYLPPL